MFTFKQYCDIASSREYTWFYLNKALLDALTVEELSIIYIEPVEDSDYMRCWYPKEKFFNQPLNRDGLERLLKQAIEKEQWAEVKQLNERMKGMI